MPFGLLSGVGVVLIVVAFKGFAREECDRPDFFKGKRGRRNAWLMMAAGWPIAIVFFVAQLGS